MPVRPLLIYPHPMLRQKAEAVDDFQRRAASVAIVAEQLEEALIAHRGLAIAAPQIGIPVRAIAISMSEPDTDGPHRPPLVLFNPTWGVLPPFSPDDAPPPQLVEEGCLSFPDVFIKVKRYFVVRLEGFLKDGTRYDENVVGQIAQAAQHETEHLDGVLLIDHASPLKKRMIEQRMRRFAKRTRKTGRVLQ
jgi:peptide deformylase